MSKIFQENRTKEEEAEALRLIKDWDRWLNQRKEDEKKREKEEFMD